MTDLEKEKYRLLSDFLNFILKHNWDIKVKFDHKLMIHSFLDIEFNPHPGSPRVSDKVKELEEAEEIKSQAVTEEKVTPKYLTQKVAEIIKYYLKEGRHTYNSMIGIYLNTGVAPITIHQIRDGEIKSLSNVISLLCFFIENDMSKNKPYDFAKLNDAITKENKIAVKDNRKSTIIEQNIPIPTKTYNTQYPFSEMKVGDSIFTKRSIFPSAKQWATINKTGYKFSYRTVENGFRLWRIE